MFECEQAVVVIPAHNESKHLPECLKAVVTAAACLRAPVLTVVVLDACDDQSRRLAGEFGADVHFVEVEVRNVGAARRAGFEYAQGFCSAQLTDESRIWYATTDADSRVDADWLVRQTEADADMVLGVVRIANWRHVPAAAARLYLKAYRAKRRGGDTRPRSRSQHGIPCRRLLERGWFRRAAHRRGRRPGAAFRAGGLPHPPRRSTVGSDVGTAGRPGAARVREPPEVRGQARTRESA